MTRRDEELGRDWTFPEDGAVEDRCEKYGFAPIWKFGLGFFDPGVLPSLVTLSVWNQIECFEQVS